MEEINKMKDFLRKRSGYLSIGNSKLQDILQDRINIRFTIEEIKMAKKAVKKEYKEFLKKKEAEIMFTNPSAVISERHEENKQSLLDQLSEIASKLGVQFVNENKVKEKIVKPIVNGFVTPEISKQEGMHLILGCNHVPFHNKKLHKSIVNLLSERGNEFKGFHLIGDFVDLNPLSSHDKGRFTVIPGLTLDDEYAVGNEVLDDYLIHLNKDCWKTFLYGNHEDRYNRWMSVMDNAKTPLISPEDGLRLKNRGFNVRTNWKEDYVVLGNRFQLFHGIYFNIHNAKKHLDVFNESCAYVHTHRVQMFRSGNKAAHNIGTCADISHKAFGYASRAMKENWSNGFAIAIVDSNGEVHLNQIVPDKNGNFYFGGVKY